jgi:hypothetical protein
MRTMLAFAAGTVLAAAPAGATVNESYSAIFALNGQSVYGPGGAIDIDTKTQTIGPNPIHEDYTVGDVERVCVAVCGSFGAEVGARGTFDVGLDYGVKVNTGSIDTRYPIAVSLTIPDAGTIVGHQFQLASGYGIPSPYGPESGITISGGHFGAQPTTAQIHVHSPTLEAFVDVHAHVDAFIGGRICTGLCEGPYLEVPEVNKTQTIVAFNRDGLGKLQIGDNIWDLGATFTAFDGNVTGAFRIPNLDASSAPVSVRSPTSLTTFTRSNFAVVNADISGIIGNAFGVPMSGEVDTPFGDLSYNLLNASTGLALALQQAVTVDFVPKETYNFLSPVQQLLANGSWSMPTMAIVTDLGESVTLRSNALSLAVTPVTTVAVRLTNLTQLVVSGDIVVQALEGSAFGYRVGPLLDYQDLNHPLVAFDLYKNSFDYDLGEVVGSPFAIAQTRSDSISATAGFSIGLIASGANAHDSALLDTEIYARSLDVECLVRICASQFIRNGSPVTYDSDGHLSFVQAADFVAGLPVIAPGVVDTDASQVAALRSAGWTGSPRLLPPPPRAFPSPRRG